MTAVSNRNLLPEMRVTFSSALWGMVTAVSETAVVLNLPLYFVGGLVRDVLLDKSPTDLDMVVEGDAIQLARQMCKKYGGDVRVHGRFGTANWYLTDAIWQTVAGVDELPSNLPDLIDFVTARRETYAEPAALPDVSPSDMEDDLLRRDFSVNTLAVRLDGSHMGELLDLYNGQADLQKGVIRVLHDQSFIDDPTRILRAVRLAQRLGFEIEPHTAVLLRNALPLLAIVTGSRLWHELELALLEADPIGVMKRFAETAVSPHIHSALTWSDDVAATFARVPHLLPDEGWLDALGDDTVAPIYLALWLLPLTVGEQTSVMAWLLISKAIRMDVAQANEAITAVRTLPDGVAGSVVEKILRPFRPRVLLIVKAFLGEANLLDRYVQEWRHVKTAVTGHDLRALGLNPGSYFADILDQLRAAKIDGTVQNEAEERQLMTQIVANYDEILTE